MGLATSDAKVIEEAVKRYGQGEDELRCADHLAKYIPEFKRAHWVTLSQQHLPNDYWRLFRIKLGAPARYDEDPNNVTQRIGSLLIAGRYGAGRDRVYTHLADWWAREKQRWSKARAIESWATFYATIFEDCLRPTVADDLDADTRQFVADVTQDVVRRAGSPHVMWEHNLSLVHAAVSSPAPLAALEVLRCCGANLQPRVSRRVSPLAYALTLWEDPAVPMYFLDQGQDLETAIQELGGREKVRQLSPCLEAVMRALRERSASVARQAVTTRKGPTRAL